MSTNGSLHAARKLIESHLVDDETVTEEEVPIRVAKCSPTMLRSP